MNQPPYIASNMCEDCIKHLKYVGCSAPCTICKMKECVKCQIQHSMEKNRISCKRVGCFRTVYDKTDFCDECTDSRTFLKECIKNVYKQLRMYKKEFKRFDKNPIEDSDDDYSEDEEEIRKKHVPSHSFWFPKNPFINNCPYVEYKDSTNKCYNGLTGKEITKDEFNNFGTKDSENKYYSGLFGKKISRDDFINVNTKCTYAIGPDAKEVTKEEFDNHPSNIKN